MEDEESDLHKSAKRRQIAAIKEKRGGRGPSEGIQNLHDDDEDQNGESETALVPATSALKKSDGQERKSSSKAGAEVKEGGSTMEEAGSSNGAAQPSAAGIHPQVPAQGSQAANPLGPSHEGEDSGPVALGAGPATQLSQDGNQLGQPSVPSNAPILASLPPPPVDGIDRPVDAPPVDAASVALPPSPAIAAVSDDKDSLAARVAQAVAAAAAQV